MTDPLSSHTSNFSTKQPMKTAGIVIIGDEILKGQVHDSNSYFICKQLYSYGVKVRKIHCICDDVDEIAEEIRNFSSAFDLVITTGGIGPTHDDMTLLGVAKAFHESTAVHKEMAELIDKWLGHRGLEREVIMRMAQLPQSAKLLFDPSRSNKPSFPIINVKNVYIFPGIPQYLEKMFSRMMAILDTGDGESNMFYNREIYVDRDEMSITPVIDMAVNEFKESVTFGSYPVVGNSYYRTRITMESSSSDTTKKASDFLTDAMPPDSIIEYDDQPLKSSVAKVYEMVDNADHPLHHLVVPTVQVLEESLEKYKLESLWICFNGGKDCTALLHLLYAVIQKKLPNNKERINALYIKNDSPFPELEEFVQNCVDRYNLKLWKYNDPIQEGLRQALQEHPQMKAVLMGTRRSDPSGKNLATFQITDASWPQVVRVSPMLEWNYGDVWKFIRTLTLPYCSLYDQGYTSIGTRGNTVPNPALAFQGNDGKKTFRPAYLLADSTEERRSRK